MPHERKVFLSRALGSKRTSALPRLDSSDAKAFVKSDTRIGFVVFHEQGDAEITKSRFPIFGTGQERESFNLGYCIIKVSLTTV